MMWRVAPTPRFSGTRIVFIDIEIYLPTAPNSIPGGMKSVKDAPCTS
jgi:hypothetical protein